MLALAWDRSRQSVLAVSTSGNFHVLEEQFTTTWPGAMYPAGFRLITDNELHLEVFDRDAEERKREKEKLAEAAKPAPVDVFTVQSPTVEFPGECDLAAASLPKNDFENPRYIPAIPIAYYHRRHLHSLQGGVYNEDKHFGLGQSVLSHSRVPWVSKRRAALGSRRAKSDGADRQQGVHKRLRAKEEIGTHDLTRRSCRSTFFLDVQEMLCHVLVPSPAVEGTASEHSSASRCPCRCGPYSSTGLLGYSRHAGTLRLSEHFAQL